MEVSSKFIAAIRNNICPACGGKLLPETTYKKIFKVKTQISELDFDENTLFGIAAALATKFTLVPKELGVEAEEEDEAVTPQNVEARPPRVIKKIGNVKGMSSQTVKRIEHADSLEAAEDLAHLSVDQEAQIQAEWGMGIANNSIPTEDTKKEAGNFKDMFSDLGTPDLDADSPLPGMGGSSREALLARAQQTKDNPNSFKIKRVDS